jgi:hypothetical protein
MDLSTGLTPLEVESLVDEGSAGIPILSFGSTLRPMRPRPHTRDVSTEAMPAALISNWTKLKSSGLSSRFYSRLVRLASDRFSSGPPRTPERLQPTSLSNFLDFWEKIEEVAAEPEISLSNDGSVVAEWFRSPEQRLDIKFGQNTAMFGLFNKRNILEGAEKKDLVALILLSHDAKPLQWRVGR